ncbi:MAG: hypothetical protein H7Y38_01350 [Armatimonadetes bacterium]|nr:hypothetical protein [Armatimonadota bacterium]
MTRPNAKPHSRFFQAVAALLTFFFGVTIAAPCVRAFTNNLFATAKPVAASVIAPEKFASVTPKVAHDALCACVDCPGSRGGNCCCASAPTSGDGYALRAVCDVAPDATSPLSPLPPMILLPGAKAIMPIFAPAVASSVPVAPRLCTALDSPLPPDAPPRLS